MEISISIVERLVAEQFPQWAHLRIRPVDRSGWDNRTFHLGDQMTVRLPSAERYTHQVKKEQEWLPKLAAQLSITIPKPIAIGQPSGEYPWNWSIYKWIEGQNADTLKPENMTAFAEEIANFLIELQKVDSSGGPPTGPFKRGSSPRFYESQTREAIVALSDLIDVDGANATWEQAVVSDWSKMPVWVHGDFSSGNILVKDERLTAVIDFGSCCVGDPSCDLVIAWTLLTDSAREKFKAKLNLDRNTWARARGWALWKALITLADTEDKMSAKARTQKSLIEQVIEDHKSADR